MKAFNVPDVMAGPRQCKKLKPSPGGGLLERKNVTKMPKNRDIRLFQFICQKTANELKIVYKKSKSSQKCSERVRNKSLMRLSSKSQRRYRRTFPGHRILRFCMGAGKVNLGLNDDLDVVDFTFHDDLSTHRHNSPVVQKA